MQSTRLLFGTALAALALTGAPALAQGEKESSAIELAEAAQGLEPGQWVWAPQISPEGPVVVLVDLTSQLLFVYRNGVNIGVSTVSTGKPGHETPTGVFQILQKDADHRSSIYNNAPMFYQQRLTWGGVALHAGGLPGYPESHGCIHLPIEFARQLFDVTTMGGTIVVTGRAGAPILAPAGGVLAPFDESGVAVDHMPLPANSNWAWDMTMPEEGPMSIVISTRDQSVVVLRNGQEVGRARAIIDDHIGTHAATLHRDKNGEWYWVMIGLPGHEGEANHPLDARAFERLQLPKGFYDIVSRQVGEGTTVVVTSVGLDDPGTGQNLTLISATD